MMNQVTPIEEAPSRMSWLYKLSGAAALAAGSLLLVAIISLLIRALQTQTTGGLLWSLQNNWLIVIYKLLAGFSEVQSSLLRVLNVLDLAVLTLVGILQIGLYFVLSRTSKVWSTIALVLPFLGIVIFIATSTAGRSAVMGAVLVSSIVMLRNQMFKKPTAVIGILASVLLFLGDFSVGFSPNPVIAVLFGFGYLLLIIWFFLIALKLFRLGSELFLR